MQSDLPFEGIQDACLELIHDTRVMTLSTRDDGGSWAAPVYYLFRDSSFYFFSNPGARHILEGEGRTGAASIFKDSAQFSQLRGIQMSGRIDRCPKGKQSAAVALDYLRKYGIQAGPGNILTFFKTRFNASMYRFIPEKTYYMDNRRGIGNRTILDL